jgi:hypothetical protein
MASRVIQVRLDDDQWAWVDEQCQVRELSQSALVRFVIDKARAGQNVGRRAAPIMASVPASRRRPHAPTCRCLMCKPPKAKA